MISIGCQKVRYSTQEDGECGKIEDSVDNQRCRRQRRRESWYGTPVGRRNCRHAPLSLWGRHFAECSGCAAEARVSVASKQPSTKSAEKRCRAPAAFDDKRSPPQRQEQIRSILERDAHEKLACLTRHASSRVPKCLSALAVLGRDGPRQTKPLPGSSLFPRVRPEDSSIATSKRCPARAKRSGFEKGRVRTSCDAATPLAFVAAAAAARSQLSQPSHLALPAADGR